MVIERFSQGVIDSGVFRFYIATGFFATLIFFTINADLFTPMEMILGIILTTIVLKGISNMMLSLVVSFFSLDNKRNEFNLTDKRLYPNSAAVEATASSVSLDLLSNGFKLRGTDSQINNSSGTYIYLAFAENPFVTSTGIPATAK